MSVDHSTVPNDQSSKSFAPSRDGASAVFAPADAADFHAAASLLATLPEPIGAVRSAELLRRHYGLTGVVEVLSSETELTCGVDLPDGCRLILKTAARPALTESLHFQARVIAGLDGPSGFLAPRLLPTLSGDAMFQNGEVCGYLQTRIEGVPMHEAEIRPDRLYRAGRALAKLTLALAMLNAPVRHRPVLWHLRCWPRLTEFATHLPRGPIADRVRAAMRDYAAFVEPRLPEVPWQMTHNDPSPFNMFVVGDETAFIDFGDGGWSPRIQDLAIAAGHFVRDPNLALGGAEHLVAGYASAITLTPLEARLLVGLIRARQGALILINHWRAHLFPANAGYIKKNVARAERGLSILATLSEAEAEAAVLAATSPSAR